MTDSIQAAAILYHDAGLAVLPADPTRKRPSVSWKRYQTEQPTRDEMRRWFGGGAASGLCILCGQASSGLEVIDFDAGGELYPAWRERVDPALMDRLVVASTPSGGKHVYLRCPGAIVGNVKLAQRQNEDGKIVTLIETRGEGGLVIAPPSPGYQSVYLDPCDVPTIGESERDDLMRIAWEMNEYTPAVETQQERAAQRLQGVPAPGGPDIRPGDDYAARGDLVALLEMYGWVSTGSVGDNQHWTRPGKAAGTSATLKDRVFYVFSSNAAPFDAGRGYSPFAVYALLEHNGDYEAAAKALRAEGYGSQDDGTSGVDLSAFGSSPRVAVVEPDQDDPEITEITPPTQPPIPTDALPEWVQQYVEEIAVATETDPGFGVMIALPVLASTLQRRYRVRVHPGYVETLNLYCSPANDSGERKSAVVKPLVGPLWQLQHDLIDETAAERRVAKRKADAHENKVKALQKQVQNTDDDERAADLWEQISEMELSPPEPMSPPTLLMDDFTEAALGVALTENHESMLLTSEEGSLFDSLAGRFGDVPELDLMLKCYDGGAVAINRISRQPVRLKSPLMSVAISPQPCVLETLGRKEGFVGRGLLARFLWALPQAKAGYRDLRVRSISQRVRDTYDRILTGMGRRGQAYQADPVTLDLSQDAYDMWREFALEIEREQRPYSRMSSGGIKSWASKHAARVARVAAIRHIAAAEAEHEDRIPVAVTGEAMDAAIRFGRVMIEHAVEAHRKMGAGSPGETAAAAVVAHYGRVGWPKRPQALTWWWKPVRGIVGNPSSRFDEVANLLVDAGYLVEVEPPVRGRPGRRFRANARLLSSDKTG